MKKSNFEELENEYDLDNYCKIKQNEKKNEMAEIRTTYARTRTLMAAERTYSAWIRTGFTVSTAGITIGKILRQTTSSKLALLIGTTLIVLGISTFAYAWIGFYKTYIYIKENYKSDEIRPQSFRKNLFAITAFSFLLAFTSILGFWLMIK